MEKVRAFQRQYVEKREKLMVEEGFDWREEIILELLEDISEQTAKQLNNDRQAELGRTLTREACVRENALAQARIDAYRTAIDHVNYYADLFAKQGEKTS